MSLQRLTTLQILNHMFIPSCLQLVCNRGQPRFKSSQMTLREVIWESAIIIYLAQDLIFCFLAHKALYYILHDSPGLRLVVPFCVYPGVLLYIHSQAKLRETDG